MTLTYISCSSDFYTFYVNIPLSLGCMIRKVSAEDIAIRGNGTGLEYMCPTRHFVYIFFNPVFQVSTAKNEISLFNNHILIVAPVTFAQVGAMTPSAEFMLLGLSHWFNVSLIAEAPLKVKIYIDTCGCCNRVRISRSFTTLHHLYWARAVVAWEKAVTGIPNINT